MPRREMEVVPTRREVIANQLLSALDDRTKVAILADEEDLNLLIRALDELRVYDSKLNRKRVQYVEDLRLLRKSTFN